MKSFYFKNLSPSIFRMTDPDFCIENYFSLRVFNLRGELILTKKSSKWLILVILQLNQKTAELLTAYEFSHIHNNF